MFRRSARCSARLDSPWPQPGALGRHQDIAVDLMVVPHQAGTTKAQARAAVLEPHEKLTARIARGLEPALLDNERVDIAALETPDLRRFRLRVAGPAALLTAKVIKIGERLDKQQTAHRLKEKDALDAFRLLQAVDTSDLVRGIRSHEAEAHAAAGSFEDIERLRVNGSTVEGRLAMLASSAAQGDPAVAPAFEVLVNELLAGLER